MCMPSAALQALVPNVDNAMIVDSDGVVNNQNPEINVFNRPTIEFIVESHNLVDLKWFMNQAVRKAACRSYALQVRNCINFNCFFFFFTFLRRRS